MRRLRSNFTLLSEESPPPHQGNSKKPLEQFSWSQILSAEPSTFRLEDPYVSALNLQNRTIKFEEFTSMNATDSPSGIQNRFDQDFAERRPNALQLFEQGDVAEFWNGHPKEQRPLELWNEHPKETQKRELWNEHPKDEHKRELWNEHPKDEHKRQLWDEHPNKENKRQLWDEHTKEERNEREQSSLSFDISSNGSESSYEASEHLSRPLQTDALMTPYPVVNPHGSVSLLLRHLVKVDITPGGAVCVHNLPGNSVITMNNSGDKTCIYHPNSRVFQDGPCVHVTTYHSRMAKICPKGVVFASSSRSLAYRVDESGTKTTADRFFDMRDAIVPMGVFCDELGDRSLERCYAMLAKTSHKSYPNGDDVWVIGDAQVKQDCYGNIEVSRNYRRHVVNVLPAVGDVSVQTPRFSASVGCYSRRYLTVQMDDRKLTSGVSGLSARNGSQKAGLDRNGKVVIF